MVTARRGRYIKKIDSQYKVIMDSFWKTKTLYIQITTLNMTGLKP